MSATPPVRRGANAVLRTIVSPALGVAVGALIVAGAASACSSTTSNADDSTIGPVGMVPNTSRPTPTDEGPQPSATPTTSASAGPVPKPGDIPDVGMTAPTVKVGMTPERPGMRPPPPPGVAPAPGFSSTTFAVDAPASRPTRRTRHVTDADATRLRGARRALA